MCVYKCMYISIYTYIHTCIYMYVYGYNQPLSLPATWSQGLLTDQKAACGLWIGGRPDYV